jgi:hypothetical protein
VALVFGWQGGKSLVSGSYADAKVKASEMKESRRAKKEEEGLEPEGVEPDA